MIKTCPACGESKEMRSNQKYCDAKCKKRYENSLRTIKKNGKTKGDVKIPSSQIKCPRSLNDIATKYWHKVAPIVIKRGHLNILSEGAFSELCDIYSRLVEINRAIDENNRSLLQIIDQWDNKSGVETQQFKESALSDLKRKYSARYLDYCKQFYLTPAANRGNFGLEEEGKKEETPTAERFF